MTSKIHLPSTGPADWRRLLADPEKHWKEGYSAKCVAERWESADGLPEEIARQFQALGLAPVELLLAIPELKTPLPGGERQSQTDVFALVRTARGVFACGVEAKVAESFGPTVAEWLTEASPGKLERLKYVCDLLGLPNPPLSALRYQLLHRTAAALIEADRFGSAGAAMLVHSFCSQQTGLADFQAFATALGGAAAPDQPRFANPSGRVPLMLAWASGPSDEAARHPT
jgi:hypothetical protein